MLSSAIDGLCQTEHYLLHVPPQQRFQDGKRVLVLVRPEEMSIQPGINGDEDDNSSGNHLMGVIELRTFLGPFTRFHVRTNEGTNLIADVPSQRARDHFVAQHVMLSFPPNACQVLQPDEREAEQEKLAEAEPA